MSRASERKIVAEDHVGGNQQYESEWHTIRAVFHNFESLSQQRGTFVASNTMECHGFEWKVIVYLDEESDNVGIRLSSQSAFLKKHAEGVKARYKASIPSANRTESGEEVRLFRRGEGCSNSWGWPNFVRRAVVLDPTQNYLVDGNLVVEVDIQVMLDKPPVWVPTNTVCSDMLKMLESDDPDDFDVTFEVGGDDPQQIFAHRTILTARAPDLADIVANFPGLSSNIPIEDVEPDVFRMLLRFIYGGEVPPKDTLKKDARVIIRAADRFGCTGLKLAAEAELATAGITTENAAELILFADGTNCAMLKEAAMDFFIKNAQEVMASEGFSQLKEAPAVMAELMFVAFGGSKKRPASSNADNGRAYKRMRVATLRQELDDRGLDVDGSKEMLVSRLEEAGNDVVQIE